MVRQVIKIEPDRTKISLDYVEITSKTPLELELLVSKQPVRLREGQMINGVILDMSPKIKVMLKRARKFRSYSEEERIPFLVLMVQENLHYTSDLKDSIGREKLSEIISQGRGSCRHFALLFGLLAQEAGLKGIVVFTGGDQLTNIIREDTGQPLFKTVPLGKVSGAHLWNNLKLSCGWVPVDPTVNLVGLTKEKLAIFKKAGYREFLMDHLQEVGLPHPLIFHPYEGICFPDEKETICKARIRCLGEDRHYEGPLDFYLYPTSWLGIAGGAIGLKIKKIRIVNLPPHKT